MADPILDLDKPSLFNTVQKRIHLIRAIKYDIQFDRHINTPEP